MDRWLALALFLGVLLSAGAATAMWEEIQSPWNHLSHVRWQRWQGAEEFPSDLERIVLPIGAHGVPVVVRTINVAPHISQLRTYALTSSEGGPRVLRGSLVVDVGNRHLYASIHWEDPDSGHAPRHTWINPAWMHAPDGFRSSSHASAAHAIGDRDQFATAHPSTFSCGTPMEMAIHPPGTDEAASRAPEVLRVEDSIVSDGFQRSIRVALAATVQYGIAVTGLQPTDPAFVAQVQAAQVVALTRVHEIYMAEYRAGLTMVGPASLISTSEADSVSQANHDGLSLLSANEGWVGARMAVDEYDLGHVFSTGGGGIATLNCACDGGGHGKARGVTGMSHPIGDPFYVDYVAHEMGHQFGANHNFNSLTGNCGFPNRAGEAAVEPGSGITIMSYAGICGYDDLASHSIPQFSWYTLHEFNVGNLGQRCPHTVPAQRCLLELDALSDTMVVPIHTPFVLYAHVQFDANTTLDTQAPSLVHSWEDADRGEASYWNYDTGDNPLWRTYMAVESGRREFVAGDKGNTFATKSRQQKFRVSVRAADPLCSSFLVSQEVLVQTREDLGPLEVLDAAASEDGQFTVTWTVAGTDALSDSLCVFVQNGTSRTCIAEVPNSGSASLARGNAALEAALQNAGSDSWMVLAGKAPNAFFAPYPLGDVHPAPVFHWDASVRLNRGDCARSCDPSFMLPRVPSNESDASSDDGHTLSPTLVRLLAVVAVMIVGLGILGAVGLVCACLCGAALLVVVWMGVSRLRKSVSPEILDQEIPLNEMHGFSSPSRMDEPVGSPGLE